MAVFQARNRIEILRQMVARVVARSDLTKLRRNSIVFHILSAAAREDANQYFQLSLLRKLFSIDDTTGSDLDERAREIQPGTIQRRTQIYASGTVAVFSRTGTIGVDPIPLGTLIAGSDEQGRVTYRTTAAGSITAGNTDSSPISIIAAIAGERGNLTTGEINQIITRIPNIVSVTNVGDLTNGRDRETDDQFRRRIKDHVLSLARGTAAAIEGFARNVQLIDGQRVLFAKFVKPVVPTGFVDLYIDDGTGTIETFDDTFVGGIPQEDVLIASASGGETEALTQQKPIRDDAALIVRVNDVPIVRNLDWAIDLARGQIELLPGGSVPALALNDKLAANYRFYTGLIQETQRVITGDPLSPLTHPGVEAGGITTIVKPATAVFQTLTANIVVLQGFDLLAVREDVSIAIQQYINNLDIGEPVILSEIIERAMGVTGVYNFKVTNLSGNPNPVDQVILPNQVARIQSSDISIS